MADLTILFLTNNKLPASWTKFHKEKLLEAADGLPIICLSREPLDFGTTVLQVEPVSKANIFFQLLKGSKAAITEYVAVAEDDCLYPRSHFHNFRPKRGDFAYNAHRWSLYTWNPIFSLKNHIRTNAALVARREDVIEALEERFAKHHPFAGNVSPWMGGEIGMKKAEQALGVTVRRMVDFKSEEAVVQMDHDFFTIFDHQKESIERRHRKSLGLIKAIEIPYWGRAESLISHFNG